MSFRSFILLATAAVSGFSVLASQTAATHKTAPKKTVAKKPVAGKTASAPARKSNVVSGRTTRSTRGKTPVRRSSFQPRQSAPTPDRLREIQSALAAKGYLKSEPSGVWDADSVDAMRRYQADQKEDPTGKITAASLIGLGLGPKTASQTPSPAADSVPPQHP